MTDDFEPIGNSDWLKEYNLLLEDALPCDSDDCDNEATCYAQVRCCGAVLIACYACMEKAVRLTEWMINRRRVITCAGCNERNAPKGWMTDPYKL